LQLPIGYRKLDLNKNLSDSFDYTKGLFQDIGRLIILMVLSVIPIVDFIVLGYMCKVIKEPLGSRTIPELKDYYSLWVQGLKIAVVIVIYLFVPIILMIPFITLMVSMWMPLPFQNPVSWFLATPLFVVGILLAFFLAIILAMAIVHMVKTDNINKAFDIGKIMNIIGTIGSQTYIIWMIVIFILTAIVSSIGQTPGVGWLLSLIVSPILGVFVSRSALITYSSSTPSEAEGTPVVSTSPEGKKFCTNCGTELSAETVYCPKCGKEQEKKA
jgi:hypothetical protein